MKIALFLSIRENRQIYEGAISLIYQPILINLGIKLIVLTRGIQWNKLQSNISINKNFRFLPLLCELCSKKVKKRKNWPSESKKKLHHDFFQIFSHINSSDRTLHLTTTRPTIHVKNEYYKHKYNSMSILPWYHDNVDHSIQLKF